MKPYIQFNTAKNTRFCRYVTRLVLLVAFVLFAGVGGAFLAVPEAMAQDATPVEQQPQSAQEVADLAFAAPVMIEGEVLFVVRGNSALPADERALKIEERILKVAEFPENTQINFDIRDHEFGLAIYANEFLVTVTTIADAELEQFELDVLAGLHVEALKEAIDRYRMGRSDEARIDSAFVAVGWTIGFFLVTMLFARKRHKIIEAAERLTEKRFTQVEEATKSVVRGQAVAPLVGFVVNVVLWIGYLFLLYYYLSFVLLSFAETRPFAEVLLTYISEPMINLIWGFVAYLPNFVTLVIIAMVTRYMIKGLRLFMDNVEAGTFEWRNFEPHWVTPTFNIGRAAMIAVAIVFAYPYIPGSDSRAFQGLTILAGIMVSLGSNTVISNMMAGLFVIYRRSTNVGDRIKVGEQVGDVVEIRLMETLIKSIKNEMVSIPNAQLLNSEVVNYSRKIDGRGLLLHTTVGIGYEEPQEKVEAMLIEAANRTASLRKSPNPFVLCTALADYAINYQINAFTTRGSRMPQILSDLHFNILTVFNENNVQIMTPSYESDPEELKIPTEKWNGKLAERQQTKEAT